MSIRSPYQQAAARLAAMPETLNQATAIAEDLEGARMDGINEAIRWFADHIEWTGPHATGRWSWVTHAADFGDWAPDHREHPRDTALRCLT